MRNGGRTWTVGVPVAAALLSGCTTVVTGTVSTAAAGPGVTSSGSHASGQPTAPPDVSQVVGATLTLADLPPGWDVRPGDGPAQGTMRTLARCLGARDTSQDIAAVSGVMSFVDAGGDAIGAFAASYRSQRDVDDDVALLRDDRAPACFAQVLDESPGGTPAPGGPSVGAGDFTLVAGSGGGPPNVADVGVGTYPVTTADGQHITVHVQFVLITGRMVEAQLFFLSTGQPLADALRTTVIATVAQRVAAL